jgi:hypothetical protein
MPSCLAAWACTRMAWGRGDVAMMKGQPHTVMMPSMIRHAVPWWPASTEDQSVSSMCLARKLSKSQKDGVEMAITSLEVSASHRDSASATVLVEPGRNSTVKSNPRSLLAHWQPYLWGRYFIVRTDHYSLKCLLDQRTSTIPQSPSKC